MKHTLQRILLLNILLFFASQVISQVVFPAIFSDNMVLQQKSDVPIWGSAKPNKNIKIVTSWDKAAYNVKSDEAGKWKVIVKTPSAGGPYEISFTERKMIKLKNIMIGEVWICSGQSNMEMALAGWGRINNYEQEIADADYPNIRLIQVKKTTSSYPLDDVSLDTDGWVNCSPATIADFSATAYFFGRELFINLNIPIGLIHTSWGGTVAEAWTSAQSLSLMPDFDENLKIIKELPKDKIEQAKQIEMKREEWNRNLEKKDIGYVNGVAIAAKSDLNESDWSDAEIPGLWERDYLPAFDGFVWYRKTIEIPSEWERKELTLSLGMIDDNDITFFNGNKIGTTDGFLSGRNYTIPANLVKKGKATIAVRVMDTGGDGGFHGESKNIFIAQKGKESTKIDLAGIWKYKKSVNLKDAGVYPQPVTDNPNYPTSLFNAMIAPIVPYALKGAIWYQGESNSSRANQYRTLFPLMINDWRTKWNQDFPFYFVQLANFMKRKDTPSESEWAELREAQLNTLHLSNTGMAVSIDIGDADDIHPKNKQDVGKRLAYSALENTYKKNIVGSGPIYKTYVIEGNKIRIKFEKNFSNLKIKGTELKGFSIAGPDRVFHWANAKIEGNDIIVSSSEVEFPVAVRYAWADNPECNLYNESGLPASPFRTDDWVRD